MKKLNESVRYKFVIDFDGTISINDSTTMLAETYIPELHQAYLSDIRQKKISVRTYIKEQLEAIRISKEEFICTLQENMLIDLSFKNFLIKEWDFVIVSAGTCQNVYYSLKGEGMSIPKERIISNQLIFADEKMTVEHPQLFYNQENGVDKAKVIRSYKKQGYQVIFIGDSISDFEGSKAADIVYAKKGQQLSDYLNRHGLPFIEYQDFNEIIEHVQTYLATLR